MKRFLIVCLIALSSVASAQEMNNSKLEDIYTRMSDSIVSRNGNWQFFINKVAMVSITDTNHNRMRIMSPIMEAKHLDSNLMQAALVANFHTALDVKYAVTDGIVWSVFIHPLQELTEHQVEDAVRQVYFANVNFGSSFASTTLTFPPGTSEKDKKAAKETLKKFKL